LERMAALGISTDRGGNEFDRYLYYELDDARLLPHGIRDAFRGSDVNACFARASSGGIWNWRDADFLDDIVLDVSTKDFLTNLARRLCVHAWLARDSTSPAKRRRRTCRLKAIEGPYRRRPQSRHTGARLRNM